MPYRLATSQYPTYYAGCCLWGKIDLALGKERLFEVLRSRDGFLPAWEQCHVQTAGDCSVMDVEPDSHDNK